MGYIAEFQPRGPEDEAFASQATDYINYLVNERCDGFMVFYTWLKDALLSKVGVVRPEWVKEDPERLEYQGLTEEQATMLVNDQAVQVVEQAANMIDVGGQMMPVYDLTILKARPGRLNLRNIKPTEFIISKDARTPDDAYVIGEVVTYTRSELKEQGYKRWKDVTDYDFHGIADIARVDDDEEFSILRDDAASPELEEVRLFMGFVKCDCNGDGVAEWRSVLVGGGPDDVLVDEEAEGQDYAVITPIPLPHKVIGMAYADPASEIQDLKTALTRQYLDSLYLANRPRTYVNMQAATGTPMIEDMLSDRIGGLIRGNGHANAAFAPVQTSLVANESLQGIQFADTMRETRLGITKYNQGLDADSLNKTATGVSKIMQASEQRLKTTLRIMANTGLKRFFKIVLRLVTQHQNVQDVVRLRNEWVTTGRLTEGSGGFAAAVRFGDEIIAYKNRAMFRGYYAGTPTVWDWRSVSTDVGCVGPEAAADTSAGHVFVGSDNIYLYDGTAPVPIATGVVRKWWLDNSSAEFRYRTKLLWDRDNGLVWIFFPSSSSSGACDDCIVYHVQARKWGRVKRTVEAAVNYVSPGITYDTGSPLITSYDSGPTIAYDSPFWLASKSNPAIFGPSHQLLTLTGVPGDWWLETGDYGDEFASSFCGELRVRWALKPGTVTCTSKTKPTSGDTLTSRGTVGFDGSKFPLRQTDRFHRFRVDGSGPGQFTAIQPKLIPAGVR